MKKAIFALGLSVSTLVFGCGPFFPASYLGAGKNMAFKSRINVPAEMEFIAREDGLIDETVFAINSRPVVETDWMEFWSMAVELRRYDLVDVYKEFAAAARAGLNPTLPVEFPDELKEFVLYVQGVDEIVRNPECKYPKAWRTLLNLHKYMRKHRTVWVHYMLGNLALRGDRPRDAVKHYKACRMAAEDGFEDSIGLAHVTFKNEIGAHQDDENAIAASVAAIGYYHASQDKTRLQHCMDTLRKLIDDADEYKSLPENPVALEALLIVKNDKLPLKLFQSVKKNGPLKSGSRLAWFLYEGGEVERAEALLENQSESDVLSNWLRFNLAVRAGETDEATSFLQKWLGSLGSSDRFIYGFTGAGCDGVDLTLKSNTIVNGELGHLYVTQNQMLKALNQFLIVDSFPDAALIAERYLPVDVCVEFLDKFKPSNEDQESLLNKMKYLCARRFFREGRFDEARKYYPADVTLILDLYRDCLEEAEAQGGNRNVQSAYLFCAARILRRKGMELSGTELAPDYFSMGGMMNDMGFEEKLSVSADSLKLYDESAPSPDLRFHYRHHASALAYKAAMHCFDLDQRATILWAAGSWLKYLYPKEADRYYKALASIPSQRLSKAADDLRWFPVADEKLSAVFYEKHYMSPDDLADASRNYSTPKKVEEK